MKLKLTNIIKETLTKKEALEAINNDFLQFVTSLGGTHEVQSDNTNVVIIDFKKDYGEEAEFEYNLETKSLHPAGISRPEDDKASALYDTLWKEKAKIFRKYIEMEKSGKISEFRRTGRQYKAQGQGGSAGNRRPGIMRGPDIEDRDDEEYTSKGDPNIDKGDFYDYSPYGFTIRFLGYEDGDDVIVRGNGFFSEKVKNGKVTFKSYPMKDAQGNRLEDAQGNRPGTPNSAYKLSDNYDESNIVDVLGNDHPFVVMTKSNHWKNNHSIDIDDNSISITLDTPNNLPRGLAPLSESKEKQIMKKSKLQKAATKLGYLKESMDNHPGSQNIDPEYRDTELDVVGTDNRDTSTTRLNLSDGSYIEVNPVELMGNAIENTDNPILMQQFQTLIKNL